MNKDYVKWHQYDGDRSFYDGPESAFLECEQIEKEGDGTTIYHMKAEIGVANKLRLKRGAKLYKVGGLSVIKKNLYRVKWEEIKE